MSIAAEIVRLERRYEDLEQMHRVALNEATGRAPGILEEMRTVQERISSLRPLAEPPLTPAARMPPCGGCGRPFWPESLTDGRCEYCGPLGGEEPSESIQNGGLKRRRASKR